MSFAQESTRYCNYSKDKFNNKLTFILPSWVNLFDEYDTNVGHFTNQLELAEECYIYMINNGWKPQEARTVLPNSLKTELVMTGFVSDWKHFFKLRCHSTAHPQARELAIPLQEEFVKRGYYEMERSN